MKVKSQLLDAQLEIKAGAPTTALKGHVVINSSSSNQVQYSDGSATRTVANTDQAQTFTNKSYDADNNTLTNVANANIKAGAAIAHNKMAALTVDRLMITDGSGVASVSSVTATEAGHLSGVTSALQTQIDAKLNKSVATTKGDIFAATASATIARLGVGSDGQVLTAASSQSTGLTWTSPGIVARTITTKTTTYTATTSDDLILCNSSGGAFTITLYTAVGNTGKMLTFKYTDSGFANAVTIDGSGSETIDGSLTTTINTQGETLVIVSDGTNWQILERRIPGYVTDFTPGLNSLINISIREATWRRQGKFALIEGLLGWNGVGSGTVEMDIPSGMTFDTDDLFNTADTTHNKRGTFYFFDNDTPGNIRMGSVTYFDSNTVKFLTTGGSFFNATTQAAASDRIHFIYSVPVSGWNP